MTGEIELKDMLTVIIVVLIIAIILDGVRRMRRTRRDSLRLSKNAKKADLETDVPVSNSEFPSGGARVVTYRDEQDVLNLNATLRKSYQEGRITVGAPQRIPEQVTLNLEESVPMLMDSVELEDESDTIEDSHSGSIEPQLGSLENLQDIAEEAEDLPPPEEESEQDFSQASYDEQPLKQQTFSSEDSAQNSKDNEQNYEEPEDVLIMNVMAKVNQRFSGSDLLDALTEEGMKLGAMDIFHRHLDNDGDAPVIFSLANMVIPGTFNLAQMKDFQTPGVSLFLSLPTAGESLAAYDDMAKTARSLAAKLDGELKDENRSVMTNQTIEHGRQRVIEFERKKKLARA